MEQESRTDQLAISQDSELTPVAEPSEITATEARRLLLESRKRQYRLLLQELDSQQRLRTLNRTKVEQILIQLGSHHQKEFGLELRYTGQVEAEVIMGADYLGPAAVEKTFGVELNPEVIPPILFSPAELLRAKELGQLLILRIRRAPDGSPLTIHKMDHLSRPYFASTREGKLLRGSWSEAFFTKETPAFGWALVSREVLPDSTGKNYLEQTLCLSDHVTKEVFKDASLPPEWEEAIQEFHKQRARIESLISDNWPEAARRLSALKLNQMARQSPVEVLYDILMRFQNNTERILEDDTTWTKCLLPDTSLVRAGFFTSGGAHILGDRPDFSSIYLGVSFTRTT